MAWPWAAGKLLPSGRGYACGCGWKNETTMGDQWAEDGIARKINLQWMTKISASPEGTPGMLRKCI